MPSSDPAQRFSELLDNITRIEKYTAGMDSVSFIEDFKTYDAVERCLSRISEASAKLGPLAETLCPSIAWPKIRGLGNYLRHEYDRMEGNRVWLMVEDNLPPLRPPLLMRCKDFRRRGERHETSRGEIDLCHHS